MRDDNMEISNAGRTEREKNKCVLLYQLTMCGSHGLHNITIVPFRTII